ncbi:beta galactosidase jelly roll domain-containing protein [Kibdelosporangium persicum]|uniref:Beta-galactosidase/beta-glucuronidase n=1 Tax=Kibdelosporangium persicum TaxID=2698649 RepID=A0ABX2FDA3_9PSEU|nr:Beta-galactosidase/beta-glucuronidase [Kibdelosporangium persicum]
MAEPKLPTPWTDSVSPANALPEYPRPQLVRPDWLSLNGVWEFSPATPGDQPPFGRTLPERVLVPYPIESALSGIARHEDFMWYRRMFDVPPGWDEHVLLHFGAVDYRATVYVNGREVGGHQGGYGSFSFDVTDALNADGPQEIIVGVEDRADATWQPIGKQRLVPDRGIFYEGASGIWQTVWIEPVPETHIAALDMVPSVRDESLRLTVHSAGSFEAIVRDGDTIVSRQSGQGTVDVPVPAPKLWSPTSPFLYDLEVILDEGDRVTSYFGMREFGMKPDEDGRLRFTLNGEFLFLLSTLDQGYWPDGIYTAPTDEALRFDLEQHKVLGFNTVRKHIKTEPDRWYHHADRLGLLVWQDMPSTRLGRPPADAQRQFEAELHEMVAQKKNWTCVVGWIPFNEGWGEWSLEDTGRIADDVKALDPTRLVNAHSGYNLTDSFGDSGRGDVIDLHDYVGPAKPVPDDTRIAIDGEHGGIGLEVDGHMWFGKGDAYEMAPDIPTLTKRYVENQRDVLEVARSNGLSGAIYTQITDVEHELNGFFTYDRQVAKMDFAEVRAINDEIVRDRG